MAICTTCRRTLPQKLAIPTTPVPELLRTYHPPSTSQINSIQQVISDADSTLDALDNKILKLEDMLDDLRRRRVALDNFKQAHQAILSPMRRLPPEIIGDIFSLCLHNRWQDRVFESREAPLLLSQVCTGWRGIALSNSRLWSTVSLFLQDSISESELALVRTWLARAGEHPLSIRLVDPWERVTHPVIDLISSCSDRWQHVELCVAQSHFENLHSGVPILESVKFLVVGSAMWTQPMNAFLMAPRLHSLHFDFPISPSVMQLPWTQITELHIGALHLDECLDIFQRSPNLVRCELGITSWNHVESTPPPPTCQILLSRLHFLRINMGDLLDYLILPALIDVHFEQYGMQWSTKWMDQLISLQRRSSCAIEKLHLGADRRISDDNLIRCLQNVPSLITLELGGYRASNLGKRAMIQLTHRVSSSQDSACVVPNLRTVKLQYDNNSLFNDTVFVEMVASRWDLSAAAVDAQVARLKTVQVSIFHYSPIDVDSESLRRLRVFRDEGLNISLRNECLNLSLLPDMET